MMPLKDQELISQLICYLDSPDQTNRPEIREIAVRYDERCRQINETLSRCADALKRGFNSDAVIIAQQVDPPLLEQIHLFRLGRLEEWRMLCQDYGWPFPPAFNDENIIKLKNSYSDTAVLKPLLDQWRQLARNGSTALKLSLLRRIWALDPFNKAWLANLDELERLRLNELTVEAKTAIEDRDFPRLLSLYTEMTAPVFKREVPGRVLTKIERELTVWETGVLRIRANNLLREVNDAYALFDLASLNTALRRWEAFVTDPLFIPTDEDSAQIESASRWMQNKIAENAAAHSYQHTLNKLISALDNCSTLSEIERLYFELEQGGESIDQALEERVRRVRVQAEEDGMRRQRLRLIVGVMSVIVLALLGAGVLHLYQKSAIENHWISRISSAVEKNQYVLALEQIDTLRREQPQIANLPEVIAFARKAVEMREERESKDRMFSSRVSVVEKMLQTHTPDGQLLAQINTALRAIPPLIAEDSPLQTEIFNRLVMQKRAVESLYNQLCLKAFLDAAATVDSKFETFSALNASHPEGNRKLAAAVSDAAGMIGALEQMENVPPEVMRGRIKALNAVLEGGQTKLKQGQTRLSLNERLRSVTTVNAYQTLLADYRREMPLYAEKFASAELNLILWRNIEKWNEQRWNPKNVNKEWVERLRQDPSFSLWIGALGYLSERCADAEAFQERVMAEKSRLSVLLSEFNYYEFIFRTPDQKLYYFYTQNFPSMELNPQRYTAEIEYARGKTQSVIFSRSRINSKTEWRISDPLLGGHVKNLPHLFNEMVNLDPKTQSIPTAAHYLFLSEWIRELEGCETLEALQQLCSKSWERLVKNQQMNSMARFLICRNLLYILMKTDVASQMDWEMRFKQMAGSVPGEKNWDWLPPVMNPARVSMMNGAVQNVKIADVLNFERVKTELMTFALSRHLRPAALLTEGKNGLAVTLLPSGQTAKELWLVRNEGPGKCYFAVVSESSKQWELDSAFAADYHFGQLLFAPADQWVTADKAEAFRNQIKPKAASWPACWPVNRRGEP